MEGARACMPWSGRAEEPRLSSALRQALGPGPKRSRGGGGWACGWPDRFSAVPG